MALFVFYFKYIVNTINKMIDNIKSDKYTIVKLKNKLINNKGVKLMNTREISL